VINVFRAGNKTANRIYRNEGETNLDFVARAINEGFNVTPDAVIVIGTDPNKSFLVTPETAKAEGLTGTSVQDALHIRMRGTKPSDLLDVIRRQIEQQKGKSQYMEFKPHAVKDAIGNFSKVESEFKRTEESGKIEEEAKDEIRKRSSARPKLEMKPKPNAEKDTEKEDEEDSDDDDRIGQGYKPDHDEKFANKSDKQDEIEERVSRFKERDDDRKPRFDRRRDHFDNDRRDDRDSRPRRPFYHRNYDDRR